MCKLHHSLQKIAVNIDKTLKKTPGFTLATSCLFQQLHTLTYRGGFCFSQVAVCCAAWRLKVPNFPKAHAPAAKVQTSTAIFRCYPQTMRNLLPRKMIHISFKGFQKKPQIHKSLPKIQRSIFFQRDSKWGFQTLRRSDMMGSNDGSCRPRILRKNGASFCEKPAPCFVSFRMNLTRTHEPEVFRIMRGELFMYIFSLTG